MKNTQAQTTDHSQWWKPRSWLGYLVVLIGLLVLLYYGYCWGLWGRHSLFLQYLFQCGCPRLSDEARYPAGVDVIVPACHYDSTRLSPSGRFLYVYEKRLGTASAYLSDLQTMQKMDLTGQPIPSFLTDDLWLVDIDHKNFIFDRTNGAKYPIQKFVYSHSNGLVNGKANLPLLAESLQQADQVFLIGASTDTVVALTADFHTHPEQNFIFDRFDLPDFNTERFLQENRILYQTVLPDFPEEAVSPDGKMVARPEGIYVVATGDKIVEGFSASRFYRPYSRKYFKPRGWIYDGSGVIYSKFLNPCLVETNFLIFDDYGCYLEVAQPVIKLKVPEEYLLPRETP